MAWLQKFEFKLVLVGWGVEMEEAWDDALVTTQLHQQVADEVKRVREWQCTACGMVVKEKPTVCPTCTEVQQYE